MGTLSADKTQLSGANSSSSLVFVPQKESSLVAKSEGALLVHVRMKKLVVMLAVGTVNVHYRACQLISCCKH